jgi:hypothetical protein
MSDKRGPAPEAAGGSVIKLHRNTLPRGSSYIDTLIVRNDQRSGRFTGSVTLQRVTGASYQHPMVGQTWPLCWDGYSDRVELEKNTTARVALAEYYLESVQTGEWKVGVLGWSEKGLCPSHMVNDPTAEFHLRIQIWRYGLLSDIFAWVLLDEMIVVKAPGAVPGSISQLVGLNL